MIITLAWMLMSGCRPPTPPVPGVLFADDTLGTTAARLRADAMTQGASPGWAHENMGTSAFGAEERWCRGLDGPAGCLGRAELAGVSWRVLGFDQAPNSATATALTWDAADFPEAGQSGWGGRLRVWLRAEDAGDPMNTADFSLVWVRMSTAGVTDRIELGSAMRQVVAETEIVVPPLPGDAADTLRTLRRSPQALSDWSLERLATINAATLAALDNRRVEKCAYGAYLGDGSPRCDRVPLTQAETVTLRAEVLANSRRRQDLVKSEGEALHAAFLALWPG